MLDKINAAIIIDIVNHFEFGTTHGQGTPKNRAG
jgi:hypothetical protein